MMEKKKENGKYILILIVGVLICMGILFYNNMIDIVYIVNDNLTTQQAPGTSADIFIQDQTTPPFDLYFTQAIAAPTTLLTATTINQTNITLTSTVGFTDGTYIGVVGGATNRFYFATQIGAPVGNTIFLDTPLDFNFSAGSFVIPTTKNLNVDGSTDTQIFSVRGGGPQTDLEIDVTRIMLHFKTSDTVDLSKFGDIVGGLTYGIVLRRKDGEYRNVWNVKTNGDLAHLSYDYDPFASTNPQQGQDGANFRYTFAGQDKHGVAVRLGPREELQILIQDDLTQLEEFFIIAEGHVVDP